MGQSAGPLAAAAMPARRAAMLGTLAFVAMSVSLLAWAKWVPSLHKLHVVDTTGAYPGHDVLAKAGSAGATPSLSGGFAFVKAYGIAVWPALLATLTIAAAIEALLPRHWLLALLGRDGALGRLTGGVAALPSMMCTCCSAPIVRTLRRGGVPSETALAYWLGSPLLNPAVLAFLAIVLPWQWVVTRLLVGAALVFGLTGPLARLASSGGRTPLAPGQRLPAPPHGGSAARRFVKALFAGAAVLVPEYLLVVFAVGLLRGWLLPLGDATTHMEVLATAVAAFAGTLVVVPTAGEIPLIAGLAAAGLGDGPLGALLICLPAISLPSMAMAGRAMGWRVTAIAALAVAACGVLAGALLWALSA